MNKQKIEDFIVMLEDGEHFDELKISMLIYNNTDRDNVKKVIGGHRSKVVYISSGEKIDTIMHKIYKGVTTGMGIFLDFGDKFDHKVMQTVYNLKRGEFSGTFAGQDHELTRKVARGSYVVAMVDDSLREQNLISESEISYYCNLVR